jgi:hypothetical protein
MTSKTYFTLCFSFKKKAINKVEKNPVSPLRYMHDNMFTAMFNELMSIQNPLFGG